MSVLGFHPTKGTTPLVVVRDPALEDSLAYWLADNEDAQGRLPHERGEGFPPPPTPWETAARRGLRR